MHFCLFLALAHVFPFIYFNNTYINIYGYELSIKIYIIHINTTNSKIIITPERDRCRSAPHDCSLSLTLCFGGLKKVITNWWLHLSVSIDETV